MDEEFGFRQLLKAGNGDAPRIWFDRLVLFVVDEWDNRIYSYNLPDAIGTGLASLSLNNVEMGEFSSLITEYEAITNELCTTARPTPIQAEAAFGIAPADSDPGDGHQASISDGSVVVGTVTSPDANRTRIYRVLIDRENRAPIGVEMSPIQLIVGPSSASLPLTSLFSDPDGDPLDFTVGESSVTSVATVEFADGIVRITPVAEGEATFDVTASDGELSSEARMVRVLIAAAAAPPEVRIAACRTSRGRVEYCASCR